jgi:F420-dependent oxidoreductase-like protein
MQLDLLGWEHTVDGAVAAAGRAARAGFGTYWLPQVDSIDAFVALGVIVREVDGIGVGIGVEPIQTSHPFVVARRALTVAQVAGDRRFTLGLGMSHRPVVEGMWGYEWRPPVTHMSEFLDAISPLLAGEPASASGRFVSARGELAVRANRPDVLLAALGPRMLELAGSRTAGTITWMVGPRTLADHTVPTVTAAARAAGRGVPRVVAGFPVCVTADIAGARRRAADEYRVYGVLPSYREMLEREGADGPEDVAVIGSAESVAQALSGIVAAGATAVAVSPFGSASERRATWEMLAGLAGG